MKKRPSRANKQSIRELFETYGAVKNVIITPRTAFINMPEPANAENAINNLDGMSWKDGRVNLKKFRSTEKSPVCRTSLGVFRMF